MKTLADILLEAVPEFPDLPQMGKPSLGKGASTGAQKKPARLGKPLKTPPKKVPNNPVVHGQFEWPEMERDKWGAPIKNKFWSR